MSRTVEEVSSLPPRWFIRTFWVGAARRLHGHGRPARPPDRDGHRWGMMRLRTVGRRSGKERTAILGYFEDGADLVTMAMNGGPIPSPPGGSTSRRIRTPPSTCPGVARRPRPRRRRGRAAAPVGQVG